jgi:hypothetical protein
MIGIYFHDSGVEMPEKFFDVFFDLVHGLESRQLGHHGFFANKHHPQSDDSSELFRHETPPRYDLNRVIKGTCLLYTNL